MMMMAPSPLFSVSPLLPAHSPSSWPSLVYPSSSLLTRLPSLHQRFRTSSLLSRHQNRNSATCQASSSSSSEKDLFPQADFYKIEAILRPWRLSHVASGLWKLGIRGVTVCDVKGFGAQGGSLERQAGSEFSENSFISKVKLEVVVSKDQVEVVIDAIIDEARTGEGGDGKIFVSPVADIIRVRTGERGLKAERMVGGRADLISAANGTGIGSIS